MTGWYFQGVVLGTLPVVTQGKMVLGPQCVFCYQMREHRSQRKWGLEQAFHVAMDGTGDNGRLHTLCKQGGKEEAGRCFPWEGHFQINPNTVLLPCKRTSKWKKEETW